MFIVVFFYFFLSCSFLDPKKIVKKEKSKFCAEIRILVWLAFYAFSFSRFMWHWLIFCLLYSVMYEAMLLFISLYFVLIISRLSISHLILFLLFFSSLNKAFYLREQLLDIIMEWNEFYSFGKFHSFTRS